MALCQISKRHLEYITLAILLLPLIVTCIIWQKIQQITEAPGPRFNIAWALPLFPDIQIINKCTPSRNTELCNTLLSLRKFGARGYSTKKKKRVRHRIFPFSFSGQNFTGTFHEQNSVSDQYTVQILLSTGRFILGHSNIITEGRHYSYI